MAKPNNVRNFWIDAQVDGQDTTVSAGPRSKDGGIDVTILMRVEGEVFQALRIMGTADVEDGALLLTVLDHDGCAVYSKETLR